MLIEYLNNNQETYKIAIAAEASALDHALVMELWLRLQPIAVSNPRAKILVQAIANLLPRRDIQGKGFSIEGLSDEQITALFYGENCEFIKEHTPKLEPQQSKIGMAPIPSTGNATSDLLAQLTRQFEGRITEAYFLAERFSFNALDAFQRTYAEVCRDPDERNREYILKSYNRQMESDPAFKMMALGM